MNPLLLMALTWLLISVIMTVFYIIQLKTKDATLVDAVWAGGLGFTAFFYSLFSTGNPGRRILLLVLAGLWSFRLVFYLVIRSMNKPEDGRYSMLRKKWADSASRNFFFLYQMQASWVILFSVPFIIVAYNRQTVWSWHDSAAVVIWIIAIGGEALADWQLNQFRKVDINKGKTCRKGLWKYSRHPNYFFEWIHWFTYIFLAIGSRWWWISISGPVIMLLFLYKLTGIPYTEKRALESRGNDYRIYQETTSAFIPWFPGEGKNEKNN